MWNRGASSAKKNVRITQYLFSINETILHTIFWMESSPWMVLDWVERGSAILDFFARQSQCMDRIRQLIDKKIQELVQGFSTAAWCQIYSCWTQDELIVFGAQKMISGSFFQELHCHLVIGMESSGKDKSSSSIKYEGMIYLFASLHLHEHPTLISDNSSSILAILNLFLLLS